MGVVKDIYNDHLQMILDAYKTVTIKQLEGYMEHHKILKTEDSDEYISNIEKSIESIKALTVDKLRGNNEDITAN